MAIKLPNSFFPPHIRTYGLLRYIISNMAILSLYSICQIPSKFDFTDLSFEYTYVNSNLPPKYQHQPSKKHHHHGIAQHPGKASWPGHPWQSFFAKVQENSSQKLCSNRGGFQEGLLPLQRGDKHHRTMLEESWFIPCPLPPPWLYQPATLSPPCLSQQKRRQRFLQGNVTVLLFPSHPKRG